MSTLARAITIAAQAHQEQRERNGTAYILHPIRLMLRCTTETAQITAILHDVVEDTTWTLAQLHAEGFNDEILAALDCLTRRPDETYEQFIERIAPNPLARTVKLADLEDNMDIRRLPHVGPHEQARLERYHRAWLRLRALPDP